MKMKILVNSSVPSIEVVGRNEKGKASEYNIISNTEVVGTLYRWEEVGQWSISTHPDYSFTVGFIGRLIQVMLEHHGQA